LRPQGEGAENTANRVERKGEGLGG
jgi:hypothetical protein